jgi:hypothetical protein
MGIITELVKDAKKAAKHGASERFFEELGEDVRSGSARIPMGEASSYSMLRLFEELVMDADGNPCGHMILREAQDRGKGMLCKVLREAADAVSTTHFSRVFGEFTNSRFLDTMESPAFIAREQLVTVVPAQTGYETTVPGIAKLGDLAEDVGEAEDYPRIGLSEFHANIPRAVKDGFIVEVTEEVLFEDKPGLIMRTVQRATESLAITMEKEILDVVLGITTTYRRNSGAKQATYANSHSNGDFDNLVASTALVDYTDIEAGTLAWDAMTDLETGEPVMITGNLQLVHPSALAFTVANILNATAYKLGADSASVQMTVSNPVTNRGLSITPVTSPYVKQRTSSDSTWFLGDFKRAFEYHEIIPPQMLTDDGGESRFNRDIVSRSKVRRRGVTAVVAPWYVLKFTA